MDTVYAVLFTRFQIEPMFDKFSANVFATIALAQREALRVGCLEVSPDHLLAGLLGLQNDKAAELLRASRIQIKTTSDQLEPSEPVKDIPLSSEAKRTLEVAWEIAQQNNDHECGTLHLIAALQQLDKSGLLSRLDVSFVRKAIDSNSSALGALDPKKIEEKIQIWQNRADMAKKQGNIDLEKQALEQKQKYQSLLEHSQD